MRARNRVASRERRRRILRQTKGYWGRKKNVFRHAHNQLQKGLTYAYAHRRRKKRDFRRLWITRLNAAVRVHGLSYSQFIHKLKQAGIALNRKMLADLAVTQPEAFSAIVAQVQPAA
ncbi:MAG: 50S ribosomal protein L20 [Bacteroidia bacterium]|nr:50S ribosomal protein L20 [Bacteroidia bacterium]MDW8088729.1 50S ribosomal protein L20 [Bacteroidia bacterium]